MVTRGTFVFGISRPRNCAPHSSYLQYDSFAMPSSELSYTQTRKLSVACGYSLWCSLVGQNARKSVRLVSGTDLPLVELRMSRGMA